MELATALPIARGLDEHIFYSPTKAKTVCTSHVLAAFGIDPSTYRYSGHHVQRVAILNRNGYCVRSRLSALKGDTTVGAARARIRSFADPVGTRYMLVLVYGDSRHLILVDSQGETIIDTAPRSRDRRRVDSIHAIFPSV